MIDIENVVNKIDEYYSIHGKLSKLKDMGIFHDRKGLDYRSNKDYGFYNFSDLLRCSGYRMDRDVLVNGKYKEISKVSMSELILLIKDFINKNNHSPKVKDFKYVNNLPSYSSFMCMLEKNDITKKDFYSIYNIKDGDNKKFSLENYNKEIEELKLYIKSNGIPKVSDLSSLGFHDSRWFVRHTKNKKVKDYNTFLEFELGEIPRFNMSKEAATKIILESIKIIGHNPTNKELSPYICESVIKRIWGSINNMKLDLGLDILGENMIGKHIEFSELKLILLQVCNVIINSDINKTTITTTDISNNCPVNFGTIDRIFKNNNTSVREFLETNGFKYQKAGNGYVYKFEDGEIVKSSYELKFSNKLRELGYKYNNTYFRDIRYKTFINDYFGLLDCDYEIHIDNKIIYIEVAGMLRDYKDRWKNPELITNSKSKKKYAEKLNIKEKMLKDNSLEYHILFPSDLKNLDDLFENVLHIGNLTNN